MVNSVYDMGGMQSFGPVAHEDNEPTFHEPWEGRVHSMRAALGTARVFGGITGPSRPFAISLIVAAGLGATLVPANVDVELPAGVELRVVTDLPRTVHYNLRPSGRASSLPQELASCARMSLVGG